MDFMQQIELWIRLATAVAAAVPVVFADIERVREDSEAGEKVKDALAALQHAVEAIEQALKA